MDTKYHTYTKEEFLLDDFFLKSTLNPTPETERYWNELSKCGIIDNEAFYEAKSIILALNEESFDVDTDRTNNLWNRIDSTNKRKKYINRFKYTASIVLAIAASIILIVNLRMTDDNDTEIDFQAMALKNTEELKSTDRIQLVISDSEVADYDTEIEVNYTDRGEIVVGNEAVKTTKGKSKFNQLIVPYGKRSTVILADGSRIKLNANTHIIYPTSFDGKNREIYVNGEIYAEIAKDKAKPFIIRTEKSKTVVLGTTLNIRSYESEDAQSVTLLSGSVEVYTGEKEKNLLKPSQQLRMSNNKTSVNTVNTAQYVSWVNGFYLFENKKLGEICNYLSQYYGVKIEIGESVSNLTCSGGLDLKEDIEKVLKGLTHSNPIKMKKNERVYQLFEN